ncbi:hypothetical protein BUALT_Bualt13G0100500 [Buddleja alternifolia]|uniref:Uncharacterized protein n=1 Tax=Buddleja alternifolia TaxID=168488 RepID=A0AAV6WX84_9LAMI|nr:hypothetical protein BUALT_Bualt13G0100500 [Buddleja alternifolia]
MSSTFNSELHVNCYCEIRAALRTSWTDDNLGRRFLSCLNYRIFCLAGPSSTPNVCKINEQLSIIPDLRRDLQLK